MEKCTTNNDCSQDLIKEVRDARDNAVGSIIDCQTTTNNKLNNLLNYLEAIETKLQYKIDNCCG